MDIIAMKEPKYGNLRKKVIFYDSDQRYAELLIRLKRDGISQPKFFRGLVTAYLKGDDDMLDVIDRIKVSKKIGGRPRNDVKKERKLVNRGKEYLKSITFGEEELENIYDILEMEKPDL
jgi:hypothetical protein